jgi:ribosomal subunit interface protein
MDIVLNSRHCELTEKFRDHAEEKLARLEKHDHRVIRVQVEWRGSATRARPTGPCECS